MTNPKQLAKDDWRLPEGAMALPDGAAIKWIVVSVG